MVKSWSMAFVITALSFFSHHLYATINYVVNQNIINYSQKLVFNNTTTSLTKKFTSQLSNEQFVIAKLQLSSKRYKKRRWTKKRRWAKKRRIRKRYLKYSRYKKLINRAARKTGVDPRLIRSVIKAESGFNPRARSHSGAVGLTQLMPRTARQFGVKNRMNPASNVMGGARYLGYLLRKYRGNKRLAIAAYNAGPGAVKRYGNRVPPYRETRRYVRKVLRNYRR